MNTYKINIGSYIIEISDDQQDDFINEKNYISCLYFKEVLDGYDIRNYDTYQKAIVCFTYKVDEFIKDIKLKFTTKEYLKEIILIDFYNDMAEPLEHLKIKDFNDNLLNKLNEKKGTKSKAIKI